MDDSAGRLSRWTRYFTIASAFALVVVQVVALFGGDRRLIALIAVFGFVCPMIFGMAYLLLPSYVGRTLVHQRLPGIHFVFAYVGAGLFLADQVMTLRQGAAVVGIVLWSLGVVVFVAELLWTIVPAVRDRPEIVLRTGESPQRSTRLASMMIPAAIGYLVAGTIALLGRIPVVPAVLPTALPNIIHYYAAGLGALLVFALGTRLMPGFFHVTPPRWGTRMVLVAGGIGPALLGSHLWGGQWFRIGALFEATAMVGYGLVVGYVYWQSDWQRIGFYGVLSGAMMGIIAIVLGATIAFVDPTPARLTVHAMLMVSGFFALTIVGYAYQFFPVTNGQFFGASDRAGLATIGGIAAGVALQGVGQLGVAPTVERAGAFLTLLGTGGYWYLIGRRLSGP